MESIVALSVKDRQLNTANVECWLVKHVFRLHGLPTDVVSNRGPQFISRFWQEFRLNSLIQTSRRTQVAADRHRRPAPCYICGQKVWLSFKDLPLREPSRKLAPRFLCPYSIIKVISPVAVKLKLPLALGRIHKVFHVSKIKPEMRINPVPSAPAPHLVDGSPAYSVKRLLDLRCWGRGFQYLVDWEGYGPEERCWVPARDILDPELINDLRRQQGEPLLRPPGGGSGGVLL